MHESKFYHVPGDFLHTHVPFHSPVGFCLEVELQEVDGS